MDVFPSPVEACVKRRGRLSSQNGVALKLWLIGTTRVVGLNNDIDACLLKSADTLS